MSKFTIKLKLQGLEIEVEGTKEDAPKIAGQIGRQLGGLLQTPAVLASGNGNAGIAPIIEGEVTADDGAGKKKRARKAGAGARTPAELLTITHDSAQYGSPLQGWTTTQKAIWFLYIAGKQASVTQLTGTNIAKNYNHYFRAAGMIHGSNVNQGLEKERLKGTNATVNADMTDGTAKYFLTNAGTTVAEKLAKGETVTTE